MQDARLPCLPLLAKALLVISENDLGVEGGGWNWEMQK